MREEAIDTVFWGWYLSHPQRATLRMHLKKRGVRTRAKQ
jgi:hypothetical protein